MGFTCGIIGLPNVGKSTLFNALTNTSAAHSANYPFTTIEPNVGRVSVPDLRLDKLGKLAMSKNIIPTQIEFVDIAGLVKGASSGEGLGNKFLGHIRQVDAIIHLVRCFDGTEITHVSNKVDPVSDSEIIETELLLADLESLERRLEQIEKKSKGGDKVSLEILPTIIKILDNLKNGIPASKTILSDSEENIAYNLDLLTIKPSLYICNVNETEIATGNNHTNNMMKKSKLESRGIVNISAQFESELSILENEEERLEFLNAAGLKESGLSCLIREGYKILDLLTFFTVGPNETRAWTIRQGSKAPEAAGRIHSDMERGFIRAEVIGYRDYISSGSETNAKAAGKMRSEGKEYSVKDGDILLVRFNV